MYTLLCSKDNTHKIVWAIGATDGDSNGNIRKHYKKGSKSVLFLSLAGRSQTKPVPNTYLDILNSNVSALTGHYLNMNAAHLTNVMFPVLENSQIIKFDKMTNQLKMYQQ